MNLIDIFSRYPDQESCIEHLETVRFGDTPHCPLCGATAVGRKADGDRVGRWNCQTCKSSFNVLSGTVMEKTRIPLQKWFLGIGIMVNAKKSVSSHQLARDLDLTQPTALYMQTRIRSEMASKDGFAQLQGVVEVDETYVGGRPRKDDNKPSKRGRGTRKTAVIGAVERGGKVVAQATGKTAGHNIVKFLRKNVKPQGTLLVTDEYKGYAQVHRQYAHSVINHSKEYVNGLTHTNTIEGFWSLVKRSWYGSHHHYSVKYLPLYIAESAWKYNNRKSRNPNAFSSFIRGCFAR